MATQARSDVAYQKPGVKPGFWLFMEVVSQGILSAGNTLYAKIRKVNISECSFD